MVEPALAVQAVHGLDRAVEFSPLPLALAAAVFCADHSWRRFTFLAAVYGSHFFFGTCLANVSML